MHQKQYVITDLSDFKNRALQWASQFPNLAFLDNNNFITLCDKCHVLIHEEHDRINNMLNKFGIEEYHELIEILSYLSSLGKHNMYYMRQIIKHAFNLIPSKIEDDTDLGF